MRPPRWARSTSIPSCSRPPSRTSRWRGKDGGKLLGFKRLFIDFQLSSIWHRAYTFKNIEITAPQVSAVMARGGALNLLQLRPPPAAPKAAEKSDPLPALRIASFKVSDGLVTYEDRSQPDVFAARLEPINFELRDFTTGVQGGQFSLTGASKQGERVEWHGHVSVDPVESDGEFQVDGLLARTLWEYLQDKVNFVVDSGTLNLNATYKFALNAADAGGGPNLQVNLSKAALTDLVVRPRPEGTERAAPWITVPALTVTGTTVDLASQHVQVDLVSLTGIKLVTWLEDGKLNLMQLTQAPGGATAAGGAVAGSGATPTATTPAPVAPTLTASGTGTAPAEPWAVALRQFEIRDADISVEDRSTKPAVKLALAPFSLTVGGISQDMTKPVTVALDSHVNGEGSLTVDGEVAPQPLLANVEVKASKID